MDRDVVDEVLKSTMNRDTALDYLCSLEEEFLARADRDAESELNESFIEAEAYYNNL
jgi:hypothetical protein